MERWYLIGLMSTIILLFIGCDNKKEKKLEVNLTQLEAETTGTTLPTTPKIVVYKIGKELNLTFNNGKLLHYPSHRLYLLFTGEEKFGKIEEKFLRDLDISYIPIRDKNLGQEFNLSDYPAIVILDRNRTIKYEGFTPYEILKAEKYFNSTGLKGEFLQKGSLSEKLKKENKKDKKREK